MALLNPPQYRVEQLHKYQTGWYVCEASDLGRAGTKLFGQVYDDACDEGLMLIDRLGRELRFTLHESETTQDGEGDVICWTLYSIPEDERRLGIPRVKLVIYND